uniref:Uncharacterized protein n=1 Tax=Knipowitschia caucasica TaxID=637954 RepID=A0AAV2K847_KNICA
MLRSHRWALQKFCLRFEKAEVKVGVSSPTLSVHSPRDVRLARLKNERKEKERDFQLKRELELKRIELEAATAREVEFRSAPPCGRHGKRARTKASSEKSEPTTSVSPPLTYSPAYQTQFFLDKGVLMRKWVPREGLKADVVIFCKTCTTCQSVGKPNQVVPPAPLRPRRRRRRRRRSETQVQSKDVAMLLKVKYQNTKKYIRLLSEFTFLDFIAKVRYKFGLPDATDVFDETNTVVEEDIFSELIEASPDLCLTVRDRIPDAAQTPAQDIILEIQIDPGPSPTTQDGISEEDFSPLDHSTSTSLTDTDTSLSSDKDHSSRIEHGIPIGRCTSSQVIPRPNTEFSELEAAKEMVKNALLCKPGGEDVIEEYNAEKSVTHRTRRQLVNILASHMTEIHGRMPSRKHKENDPHGEVASEGFEDDQKDVLSEQDVVTEVTPVRVREVANPPGTLPRFEPFSPDAGVSGVSPPGTGQGQASSTAKIKLRLARLQLETEEKVRKADYELKLQVGPSYDSWSRQEWILGKDQTHKVSPTTGAGIDFILGNDLAGSKVVPVPQLVERTEQSTELESPNVFPACAVTRSQSKNTVDLSDSFMATEEFFQAKPDVTSRTPAALDAIPLPATRAAFITAQKGDSSLSKCFSVVEQEGSGANKVGYLMDEGLLMRRWSSDVTGTGDEKVLYQVVVPKVYRAQMTGKPNQVIPPAPLSPIPDEASVFQKMKMTFQYRQDLVHDPQRTTDVFKTFPRFLDVKGLLNQDFFLLFGAKTSSKMLEKWDTTFRPKVINEAKHLTQSVELCRLQKAAEKPAENDETTWDSDMASLLLLLHLLPPTAGRKRTKISSSDAVNKMLHFHKSCCSLDEHLLFDLSSKA